jgi:hypothetical protein
MHGELPHASGPYREAGGVKSTRANALVALKLSVKPIIQHLVILIDPTYHRQAAGRSRPEACVRLRAVLSSYETPQNCRRA